MIQNSIGPIAENPLELVDLPVPAPDAKQILLKVLACGVCHTELDQIEGRLPPKLPIIPGHQIIGTVERIGSDVTRFSPGRRVGVAWINSACGQCRFCRDDKENLCSQFQATGYHVNGGYAEYTVVGEDFAYPIPETFSDTEAAPLLCAGAIGYRAVKLTNLRNGQVLGLFGFGASAHIAVQIVKYRYPDCRVFVFTRPGQKQHQDLAVKLGADWVSATGRTPPAPLDCAIDFTPAWQPLVEALKVLERSGRLVINAIRKEPTDKDFLLNLDYTTHLWLEKEIKTVANITRSDAREFLALAGQIPIRPRVEEFELKYANQALNLLKKGKIQGAAVLKITD